MNTAGNMARRGLRTDAVIHLGRRIELDTELAVHEPRRRLLELRNAVVGVAPVLWLVDLLGHHPPHTFGGHRIVLADAEVEQLPLGIVGQCLAAWPA